MLKKSAKFDVYSHISWHIRYKNIVNEENKLYN